MKCSDFTSSLECSCFIEHIPIENVVGTVRKLYGENERQCILGLA